MRDGIVLTRAPLRVSFVGGGSDLAPCGQVRAGVYGAVVSAAIDRYVWCLAKARRDGKFFLSWREKEVVDDPADFHHEIVRACFQDLAFRGERFERGVELAFVADVPGGGSGLGSSAATAAACLLALDDLASVRTRIGPGAGARDPDLVRTLALRCAAVQPNAGTAHAGLQDEYATARGGLAHLRFSPGPVVEASDIPWNNETDQWIRDRFALFSPRPGAERSAGDVLATYRQDRDEYYRALCIGLAAEFESAVLARDEQAAFWAVCRHAGAKRDSFTGYASPELDAALVGGMLTAGAECVKLCGAGGTGHVLAGFPPERREAVAGFLEGLWGPELPLRITPLGASVMWGWERRW